MQKNSKSNILRITFWIVAGILSHAMCAIVAFNYCNMLYQIKYFGASAPASTAYLLAIPFMLGIAVTVSLAVVFTKKMSKKS